MFSPPDELDESLEPCLHVQLAVVLVALDGQKGQTPLPAEHAHYRLDEDIRRAAHGQDMYDGVEAFFVGFQHVGHAMQAVPPGRTIEVLPVSYTHLTLPTKR